jgi:PleD family two-component response regulator
MLLLGPPQKRMILKYKKEISQEHPTEVDLIKHMSAQFPDTVIIVVDGDADREVIARAFSYGVKDAFRKPYNRALIVGRVKALLSRKS